MRRRLAATRGEEICCHKKGTEKMRGFRHRRVNGVCDANSAPTDSHENGNGSNNNENGNGSNNNEKGQFRKGVERGREDLLS